MLADQIGNAENEVHGSLICYVAQQAKVAMTPRSARTLAPNRRRIEMRMDNRTMPISIAIFWNSQEAYRMLLTAGTRV